MADATVAGLSDAGGLRRGAGVARGRWNLGTRPTPGANTLCCHVKSFGEFKSSPGLWVRARANATEIGNILWCQDGWFRRSIPFEPLCNCPESGHDGEVGLLINGYSQIWESAVMADMWDQCAPAHHEPHVAML